MADGSLTGGALTGGAGTGGGASPPPAENPGRFARAGRWLTRTRPGVLTIIATVAGLALAGVLLWHFFRAPLLTGAEAWAMFAAASAAFILPVLLLLLDPPDNMAKGPHLALPLATLALLAILAAATVADRVMDLNILSSPHPTDELLAVSPKPMAMAAFFILLAAALAPRIWNATLFAAYKHREIRERAAAAARKQASADTAERIRARELKQTQDEHSEADALSALTATLVAGAVIGLAWYAGAANKGAGLAIGLGVWIAGGVIGLFIAVVLLKWISESAPVRAMGLLLRAIARRMGWLAAFYDAIDTVLVRIGAHVAGAEHHSMAARYVVLAGTLGCLAVMAWYLPAPLGLAPAVIGFVIALSVSRLWSWVEDDRNMASITQFNPDAPQRVGFREDYRDETLTGFIFVLILIPIAMMQADVSRLFGGYLFDGQDKDHLREWVSFFGFELAKALPVVDWADIYRLQPGDNLLQMTDPLGMHAVFAARATVDLLLIAALFQAIAVATRNRQQKALYAAGHINRLDEMVEREELKRVLARPATKRFTDVSVDFRSYNPDRLRELYSRSQSPSQRAFIERIFEQRGLRLDPAIIVLDRIARTTRNESDLMRTFDAVRLEHETGLHKTPVGDLMDVMESLRTTSGLRSLKADIMAFAVKHGPPLEVAEMLLTVMVGSLKDDFKYTRIEAARLLREVAPQLPPATLVELRREIGNNLNVFGQAQGMVDMLLRELAELLATYFPGGLPDEGNAAQQDPTQNKP